MNLACRTCLGLPRVFDRLHRLALSKGQFPTVSPYPKCLQDSSFLRLGLNISRLAQSHHEASRCVSSDRCIMPGGTWISVCCTLHAALNIQLRTCRDSYGAVSPVSVVDSDEQHASSHRLERADRVSDPADQT
ncbi:uncharacterized protein FOMMEDRAFT_151812 [Fomitiporia mediterranea MF3/22]|uniref:uncharacterized protein n=1 Tax=Fomitiporia mediterranea (strain MF3/22) TaxID=694068 RepID=UPI0004409284|nr:uncharacterized protein FOMMEDRAFT_151812 [Fomitiporia mediterranea MF3/22]EJD06541.1 hypothetical protein FOMMEDRAFT_151812 [Fomitiporia mediterranea MF3/22]